MGESGSTPEKKIVLPSSGLAEDILASMPEAAPRERQWYDVTGEMDEGQPDEGQAEEESLHLVGFFLGSEEYGIDISQVHEIIRVGGWTRVPNAPAHIKGVINLRGRIIAVLDPKVRMGFAAGETTRDSRIMVIELGKKTVGILVDSVSQVLRLPVRTIEAAPAELTEAEAGYVKGVGKLDGRLIILIDLARLSGGRTETGV